MAIYVICLPGCLIVSAIFKAGSSQSGDGNLLRLPPIVVNDPPDGVQGPRTPGPQYGTLELENSLTVHHELSLVLSRTDQACLQE